MAIDFDFAEDPSRVEFAISGRVLAPEIHAAYRAARSHAGWVPGMRALWRVPASVDMSEIDLEAIQRDVFPGVPALFEAWGKGFRSAWLFDGPSNATRFDLGTLMPGIEHTKRFDTEAEALAWLGQA